MAIKHKNSKKDLIIALLAIVLIAGGSVIYFHYFHKKSLNLAISDKNAPVVGIKSTPTAPQLSTSNGATSQGGVVSNNGQTTGSLPPSSDWVSSANDNITLQQPSANSTLASGDEISGLANVSNVEFILTDNSVGQIAQGSLNVVNGKFSGTLQFTPHASTGTLQVYYPNPANGAEEDIIEIDVNFNT